MTNLEILLYAMALWAMGFCSLCWLRSSAITVYGFSLMVLGAMALVVHMTKMGVGA